ncbi:MAG: hypothetical protein FIA94_13825 [Nitrospirae bacterium]|nr:hypothetical protein [Nitrospirota bacterium]
MINPNSYIEAKEYFIQKVLVQAEKENIQLSRAQKYMLQWSEADPTFHIDQTLNAEFEREITTAEYEKKISKLIIRAYNNDRETNKATKDKYQQAYKALKSEDNYLFILVDKAIGRHFNKVGLFFGSYPVSGNYLLYAIFFGILFLFDMSVTIGTLLSHPPLTADKIKDSLPDLFKGLLLGSLVLFNILKYRRYKKEKF